MYIKRNVYFSAIDQETGEERLFSVNEVLDEETYLERLYSESEKKDRKSLSRVDSHKGLKRAILTSPITGGGSLVGGYIAKNKADELDSKGMSDDDILIGAKSHGGKVGAVTGAVTGTAGALTRGLKPVHAAMTGLAGAGLGYIGGSQAAKVNTKERLRKRKEQKD